MRGFPRGARLLELPWQPSSTAHMVHVQLTLLPQSACCRDDDDPLTPCLQACAGLSYSFSIYAPAIKDKLNLSQTQLAYVGSSVNLGGYFAILAGSIYDALKEHHKFGPRYELLAAIVP